MQNPKGQFYVGQTDNVPTHLPHRNRTDNLSREFTRQKGPCGLVWSEFHPSQNSAVAGEREIKHWKSAETIRLQLLGLLHELSG